MIKTKLRVILRPEKEDKEQKQCRSTILRRSIKINDPERYEKQKLKDRERKRKERENAKIKKEDDSSRESRMKYKREKELNRERVRKHRALKKLNMQSINQSIKTETTKKEKRREYLRLKKQRERSNHSRQKHEGVKLSDRTRKRKQRNTSLDKTMNETEPPKKKAKSYHKKRHVLQKASMEAAEHCFNNEKNVHFKKKLNNTYHKILKKYRLKTTAAERLGLSRRFNKTEKRITKKISTIQKTAIHSIYHNESIERPEKRYKGKRLLKTSMRTLYRKYKG